MRPQLKTQPDKINKNKNGRPRRGGKYIFYGGIQFQYTALTRSVQASFKLKGYLQSPSEL